MKYIHPILLIALTLAAGLTQATAQGTAFTYQGRLDRNGSPAPNGYYDFQFRAFDAVVAGGPVGLLQTAIATPVTNGIFNVRLDFGSSVFTGPTRWLSIVVKTNGEPIYTQLSPRTELAPTPYAIFAGGVAATGISGLIPSTQLAANVGLVDTYQVFTADKCFGPGAQILADIGSPLEPGYAFCVDPDTGIFHPAANTLALSTAGAERLRVTTDGNVGVGLTSPTARFHVDGVVRSSGTNGGMFRASNPNNGSAQVDLSWLNDVARLRLGGSGVGAQNGLDIQTTSDRSLMRLTHGGNVGIGVADPAARLHVAGSGFFGADSGGLGAAAGIGVRVLYHPSTASGQIFAYDYANSRPVDLLLQQPGGKVGIGTTAPLETLHVAGDVRGDDGYLTSLLLRDQDDSTRVSINAQQYLQPVGAQFGVRIPGGHQVLRNRHGKTTIQFDASAAGLSPSGQEIIERAAGQVNINSSNGASRIVLSGADTSGGGRVTVGDTTGSVTVEIRGAETTNQGGQVLLYRANGKKAVVLDAEEGNGNGGEVLLYNSTGDRTIQIDGDDPDLGGWIGVYNKDGDLKIQLDSNASGGARVTTQVLEITGGSDLSENFDIKPVHDELQAGMLVSIDPQNPGQLVVSSKAYDRTVAGVMSGAGGVQPGMLMGQRGSAANGKHPVALTGRVYCWVDADAGGAIAPGDLITTSGTPGHGMKVGDQAKAQGAIIGKAMTKLDAGKGLVMVLVSLQ